MKRIARTIFWLTLISAASQHNILLGLVLYPFAAAVVVGICLSPVLFTAGLGLAWYWRRHRRLPVWLHDRVPSRTRDLFGWRLRSPVRRRWPRPPAPHEAPTEELHPVPAVETPAGAAAGRAAASHLL